MPARPSVVPNSLVYTMENLDDLIGVLVLKSLGQGSRGQLDILSGGITKCVAPVSGRRQGSGPGAGMVVCTGVPDIHTNS